VTRPGDSGAVGQDPLYERWRSGYASLEADLSRFREHFAGVRKCGCDMSECAHYRRARHRVFGERIDRLFNMRLQSAAAFHREMRR